VVDFLLMIYKIKDAHVYIYGTIIITCLYKINL